MNKPSSLHQQAIKLREQGKSVAALAKYEAALVEYLDQPQLDLIPNILLEKIITYRHLYQKNKQAEYLLVIYGHLQTASGLVIAQTGEQAALVELAWGEYFQLQKEYAQALQHFSQALQKLPVDHIAYGNFRAHFGWAHFLDNQAGLAQEQLEQAIYEIQDRAKDHDQHQYKVWLSGAQMKLARVLLKQDQPAQAQKLLTEVEKLLDQETEPLRWNQLLELKKEISK